MRIELHRILAEGRTIRYASNDRPDVLRLDVIVNRPAVLPGPSRRTR